MKISALNTLSCRNHTGVRNNPTPVVSADNKNVNFSAKGGSDKKVWPKIVFAVILLLPFVVMAVSRKNKNNED